MSIILLLAIAIAMKQFVKASLTISALSKHRYKTSHGPETCYHSQIHTVTRATIADDKLRVYQDVFWENPR